MQELKKTIIIFEPTEQQKAKIQDTVNECIDIIRKKHKLNIQETAYCLDILVSGFNDTVRDMK